MSSNLQSDCPSCPLSVYSWANSASSLLAAFVPCGALPQAGDVPARKQSSAKRTIGRQTWSAESLGGFESELNGSRPAVNRAFSRIPCYQRRSTLHAPASQKAFELDSNRSRTAVNPRHRPTEGAGVFPARASSERRPLSGKVASGHHCPVRRYESSNKRHDRRCRCSPCTPKGTFLSGAFDRDSNRSRIAVTLRLFKI